MTVDQFASAALIVCCVAFAAISLVVLVVRILTGRDQQDRDGFALAYCDLAGHHHWLETGADDWTPGDTPVFEQLCVDTWETDLGDSA